MEYRPYLEREHCPDGYTQTVFDLAERIIEITKDHQPHEHCVCKECYKYIINCYLWIMKESANQLNALNDKEREMVRKYYDDSYGISKLFGKVQNIKYLQSQLFILYESYYHIELKNIQEKKIGYDDCIDYCTTYNTDTIFMLKVLNAISKLVNIKINGKVIELCDDKIKNAIDSNIIYFYYGTRTNKEPFRNCSFTDVHFKGDSIHRFCIHSTFDNCIFKNCIFSGNICIKGAQFKNCVFKSCDLTGLFKNNCMHSTIEGCKFNKCKIDYMDRTFNKDVYIALVIKKYGSNLKGDISVNNKFVDTSSSIFTLDIDCWHDIDKIKIK